MSGKYIGVTFAKQKVSPSDDAIIRRAILPDGTLTGCEITYSGSTLTMAAGQLMVCGRQIRNPAAQNYAIVDATSGFARLVLTIDLTRTSTKETFDQVIDSIEYASSEDGFVMLDQADINGSGTRYQVAVCTVSLGAGGITGIVSRLERCEVGAGLNFKLVGGLTQPSGQKENTIWVSTNAKITGYYFSPTQPEELEDGNIWIVTGTSSPVAFSATKKNPIVIHPLSAKQMTSGILADVPAKSFQNGKWVDWWNGELYDSGNEYESFTGGWVVSAIGRNEGAGKIYDIERTETNITIPGVSQKGCIVHPANKIDLTGKTTLSFTGSLTPASNTGYYSFVGVWSDFGADNKENLVAMFDATKAMSGTQEIPLNGLSGKYYVGIAVHGATSSAVLERMKVS